MTDAEKKVAEKVMAMLERQKFAKWYGPGGDFDKFIAGDLDAPSKEKLLQDILEMLHLP
jgi:hypothetical protein